MMSASQTYALYQFLDRHLESGHGGDFAIRTPDASYTYRDLDALVNRAGNVVRALGVQPEQRVALLLADGVEFVAVFFGTIKVGAVAVPLNTRLTAADYQLMLRDSRAKILVADGNLLPAVEQVLPDLPHLKAVLVVGEAPSGYRRLHDLLRDAEPTLDPEPMSCDDMAFWLYTSGTTATPKAAVHLRRDLLACRYYGLDVLGASAQDRIFATSKLFFAYALGNALLIPMFVGAQTFLHPAWAEPETVAAVMAAFRPTLFFSVPTFYARLVRADLPRDTFRSLRCVVSAGERLPEEIYWAMRERYGVKVLDGMGTTETIFMVLSNHPGESRPGSSGTPVPATDVRLLDAEGREVPDGTEGVLHIHTPSASPAYWNRLDQSRRAFLGEWFRTGDVYVRDAEGFYYHCGRADDLFKVAGLWVAPTDVESALLAHPEVADAGVVGAEDERGLLKPVAFVVPRKAAAAAGLTEALARLCNEKLAPHQRPRRIVLVDDLPRTATGKLQRFRLRESHLGSRVQSGRTESASSTGS